MTTQKLTGEQIEELKELATVHHWPHARPINDMSEDTGIKLITKGQGVWVEDAESKKWFDMMASMWLVNIGHGRREIADAVHQQMQDLSFSPGGGVSPSTVKLAAKVASLSPDSEARVYFVSGGSEANESAIKMAKNYHLNNGDSSRWKVISRRGSYHGATYQCMAMGGGGVAPPANFGPLMPGNIHITQPNEYRCAYCADRGGCNLQCAQELDRVVQHEGPATVAAFIGEPISAAAGVHVPHAEYWPTIQDICNKHGVLMICDEVITGFGRTGKMFATENWGVKPDIFTTAKALTGGYLPIGAATASKKIADSFTGDDRTFNHLFTYGGNPASCAAGLATLEIMETERMVENSAKMGDYLYEQLQTLYEHRIVGDIRGGMGLLAAVELVKDRDTKEKFPANAQLAKKLKPLMDKYGLMGRPGDILPMSPPLCITKDEVDYLVNALDQTIGDLESNL